MTCIIIEDQPPAQRILEKYIEDVGYLELRGVFSNALDAMSFLKSEKVSLIFLDIHLPKISGLDFLKSAAPDAAVVLTTAFSDYALESYEYNVLDYLLKPFSFERFVQAISKLDKDVPTSALDMTIPSSSASDTIFVKSGYEYVKVDLSDIVYIKSEADYTELHTTDKRHLTSSSLKHWLERLNSSYFHQIHKSYIVNMKQVKKVVGNMTTLSNGAEIPIGRSFKKHFGKRFLE